MNWDFIRSKSLIARKSQHACTEIAFLDNYDSIISVYSSLISLWPYMYTV